MKSLLQYNRSIMAMILVVTSCLPARAEQQATKDALKRTDAARETALVQAKVQQTRNTVQQARVVATANAPAQHLSTQVMNGISMSIAGPASRSRVLVVPTAKTTSEQIASLTEDLKIMALIFDKKLSEAGVGVDRRSSLLLPFGNRTEVLHLQGYGSIFMISVNFPLKAPTQTEQSPDESSGDPLWEQMKHQHHAGGTSDLLVHQPHIETAPYDPEKVQKFKKTIIETLKHASNIRDLGPDEYVIITAQGTQPASRVDEVAVVGEQDPTSVLYLTTRLAGTGTWSPEILTMRARKADIDAFAAGKITIEKFAEKAESFTSYGNRSSHGPMLPLMDNIP